MEVRKKGWQKLLLAIFVRMIHWMRNVLYLELSASKVFGDLENPHFTNIGDWVVVAEFKELREISWK